MNAAYDCPNCGGAVAFQSSIAVFAVCPHCQSMVVRHDVNVEAIGQMAALPPDLSPLQLGAHGECGGQAFTLIGRVRLAYDDGSWNEWCALFGDGRYGWVAEAQGFFMVSFESALPPEFPSAADGLPAGQAIEIEGQSYEVTDRKETVCLGSEGELPFAAKPGRKGFSVDLTGDDGQFASADFSEAAPRLFVGRYARFDDLKFTDLRAVPGWSEEDLEPAHHQTTALSCPNCGAAVMLRAAGYCMSATCGSCGSLIDTATPELSLIRRAHERQRLQPQIPLGRRGVLFGVNYEVIGFQHVKDQYSGWFEYLLFNPWQGFVWLVTYNGHWSFARRLWERPEVSESVFKKVARAKFNGETYRIYAASEVSTDYVVGEFYWKVRVGMPAHVTDFIHPPRILSREAYPQLGEQTWSQGEYVEPEILQQAFNLEEPLREPEGIYLNQPNRYAAKGKQLLLVVPLLLVAMILIQVLSARHAAHREVFNAAYRYRAGVTNPVAVTEPFEIPGGKQALAFTLTAPVDNNWLELDIDLVNAATPEVAATFEQGVEYYHGYEDGENWTEGGQTAEHLVPAVPPGRYYLTIDAAADPTVAEMPFNVTVVRDVLVWSNFWIALGLLLPYPLYCWFRASRFETARWADSDYSPYGTSGSDDDD